MRRFHCVRDCDGDATSEKFYGTVCHYGICTATVETEPFIIRSAIVVLPRTGGRTAGRVRIVVNPFGRAGSIVRFRPSPMASALAIDWVEVGVRGESGGLRGIARIVRVHLLIATRVFVNQNTVAGSVGDARQSCSALIEIDHRTKRAPLKARVRFEELIRLVRCNVTGCRTVNLVVIRGIW